jgi:hypothetical protein
MGHQSRKFDLGRDQKFMQLATRCGATRRFMPHSRPTRDWCVKACHPRVAATLATQRDIGAYLCHLPAIDNYAVDRAGDFGPNSIGRYVAPRSPNDRLLR